MGPAAASDPRRANSPSRGDEHGSSATDPEDSDHDPGMFSYARPATGQLPHGTILEPTQGLSSPSFESLAPNPFGFSVPYAASQTVSTGSHSLSSHNAASLSPAAAYALSACSPSSDTRKRIPFPAPGSPSHIAGNPYEFRSNDQAKWSCTSREAAALDAEWADQSDLCYALTSAGQTIMLDEMGEPVRLATDKEQKMLDSLGSAEDNIPYHLESDFEAEEEDSPYAEVRASVSNIDDPEMPVLTLRVWLIGLLFCIIISALNTFFALRYPAPLITPIVTQILSFPIGKLLARLLPIQAYRFPNWSRRYGFPDQFSFNPGPFNIKEHAIIVMMANISTAPSAGITFSLVSEKFYGIKQGLGFDILLILTTQIIGFGAAGLCRRFLVWPAAMIWPQNLVYCTLLNTLHAEDEDEGQGISRLRFFIYAFCAAFLWYWLPGFLFTALSAFSWVCWIAPNNVVVNQLFGVSSGLGMGLLTFDWGQIAYLGSPLVIPWWAEANVFCGFALAFWVIAPIMYYSNVWDSAYLPISTSQVFDRYGAPYNTSAVVDPHNLALNETAYHDYSPLYLPVTFATVYGLALMLSTSVIIHTILAHGRDIWSQIHRRRKEEEDVHCKLMRNYPEVPDWWYLVFLLGSFALSVVTLACFDTKTPVWSLVVALAIGLTYVMPSGIVYALTNQQVSINLIVELVAGYIVPGQPLANMLFKTYSTQTILSGLGFIQDLKFGHYMKIPPRATFAAQIIATTLTSFVQFGVKQWLLHNVRDLCEPHQHFLLTCPGVRVFYSASVTWGLIGPARQFGIDKMYNPILYWLLGGAILPVIFWALAKFAPRSPLRYVNVPVALTGAIFMPPATGINFSSWILVGFIFQYLLRRRRFRWWSKFNFVLSAALDSGTVISGLVIFFSLSLPKNGGIALNWWGNDVYTRTLDWAGVSYRTIPPEGFGRTSW